MASTNYIVLELSSPSEHTTIQANSVSLVTQNGEEQLLPNHSEFSSELKEQVITVIKNDAINTQISVPISNSITKLYHEGDRTRLLINCMYYNHDISHLQDIESNTKQITEKAKELVKTDLTPTLDQNKQNLRDIESNIRSDFENEIKS